MTLEEQIIDSLTQDDLSGHGDLSFIAESCGIEVAKLIIRELGGMAFSIPTIRGNYFKPMLTRYLLRNCKEMTPKAISRELSIHERTIEKIISNIKKKEADERQLSLY